MNVRLPYERTPKHWKSQSRIAGEAAEMWVLENIKCPCCKKGTLKDFVANEPVKDFYCDSCSEEFQLKATKRYNLESTERIQGSAYEKWRDALENNDHPNILVLTYNLEPNSLIDLGNDDDNSFRVENKYVLLMGHRIFKRVGHVNKIYFIPRKEITEENLIEREELGDSCRRAGWKGSYIEIDNSVAKEIFGNEEDS